MKGFTKLLIVGIVAVLVLLGAGTYWIMFRNTPTVTVDSTDNSVVCNLTSDRTEYRTGDPMTFHWTSSNVSYVSFDADVTGPLMLNTLVPGAKRNENGVLIPAKLAPSGSIQITAPEPLTLDYDGHTSPSDSATFTLHLTASERSDASGKFTNCHVNVLIRNQKVNTNTLTRDKTLVKAPLNLPDDPYSMEKYYYDRALNNLPNADKATFEALVDDYASGGSILFRDKNNVYFYTSSSSSNKAEVLTGVDRETFVHVKDRYYKDKNSVYYFDWNKDSNALIKIAGANSVSFQALNYWYTKDNQQVFFLGVDNTGAIKMNTVDGALANSFLSVYSEGSGGVDVGRLGTDSVHVFSWGKMVSGADVKTFSALDDTYFKDANSVYTYGSVQDDGTRITKSLDGVSPQNFVALGEGYGKTGDSVYFFDKKIVGADVATFKATVGYGGGYAEDKNHVYKDGVIVQQVNSSGY